MHKKRYFISIQFICFIHLCTILTLFGKIHIFPLDNNEELNFLVYFSIWTRIILLLNKNIRIIVNALIVLVYLVILLDNWYFHHVLYRLGFEEPINLFLSILVPIFIVFLERLLNKYKSK